MTGANYDWTGAATFTTHCLIFVIKAKNNVANKSQPEGSGQLESKANVDVIFCVACKPGYRPKTDYTGAGANTDNILYVSNLPSSKITECNAITNCDTTSASVNILANGCAKCKATATESNKTFFLAYRDLFYNDCAYVKTANCFVSTGVAIPDTTPVVYACDTCNPGYFLNQDGMCEQLSIVNCTSTNDSDY